MCDGAEVMVDSVDCPPGCLEVFAGRHDGLQTDEMRFEATQVVDEGANLYQEAKRGEDDLPWREYLEFSASDDVCPPQRLNALTTPTESPATAHKPCRTAAKGAMRDCSQRGPPVPMRSKSCLLDSM